MSVKAFFSSRFHALLRQSRYVKELSEFKKHYRYHSNMPAGHYYSPITNPDEIKTREDRIWKDVLPKEIAGIDLNLTRQVEWLSGIKEYYAEIPFKEQPSQTCRYYYDNVYYSYTDAIVLYSFIRKLKPHRIVEVGSGYSSAAMLDTRDHCGYDNIRFTFIDPFPDRLQSLLQSSDKNFVEILPKAVQDVDKEVFSALEPGDILFIDSSHVMKTGSDLHFLMFEILPILKEGVFIHIHDIFYPFQYPKEWVYGGYNWNELYAWQAFLMYNANYKIEFFSHYLHQMHADLFIDLPLCQKNKGGNLWLQKIL